MIGFINYLAIFLEQVYTVDEYWNSIVVFSSFLIVFAIFVKLSLHSNRVRKREPVVVYSYQGNAQVILEKYFPYYTNLDPDLKREFLKRVIAFLNSKTFIPRKQNSIPNELPVLISATAIQLTFGLHDFSIFSFSKILIYPSTYYNEIRKVYHQGEINVRHRIIVLSTSHFLGGLSIPDDGLNLGLHELAHALNIHAFDYQDQEFIKKFKAWRDIALIEMPAIQEGNHFLRSYAAINIMEMFAVCTENFFERPLEFQQRLPDLFLAFMNLLGQNPIQKNRPI